MKKLVYLAGAMGYYRDKDYKEAVRWRADIRNNLTSCNDNYYTNFHVFDPTFMENEDHDVVTQNNYYLDKADLLVVNLKDIEHSLGTIYEITYAKTKGIPIISIGNHIWKQHPHMKYMLSASFNTVKEACEFIANTYRQ